MEENSIQGKMLESDKNPPNHIGLAQRIGSFLTNSPTSNGTSLFFKFNSLSILSYTNLPFSDHSGSPLFDSP